MVFEKADSLLVDPKDVTATYTISQGLKPNVLGFKTQLVDVFAKLTSVALALDSVLDRP